MNQTPYKEVYTRLNPEQKEAVDTIEGPVMVIAGPGTGKTQILTLRIAHILENTDTKPENILALTFTESGAKAMKERLASYIGAPAYRVAIRTFHEFAGECIRTYPDAYERAVGGRPITDIEKINLLETILETPDIKLLRPSGNIQFYIQPILSALSLMKRENITPNRFLEIIEKQQETLNATQKIHEKGAHKGKVRGEYIDLEKRVSKNRELLFVYRAYEAALKTERHFDFDDMIFETVHALENNEDMLRQLQEQYQYILADEHQDVNGSQNRILELLASYHERPNIFVVGDEKQSIYRFQGASLENFLYFEEKFPYAKTIILTTNYRSKQEILDLSQELITVETGPADELRVPLQAATSGKAIIEKRQFSHEAVEHEYVTQQVKKLIEQDTPLEEIAVILRTNREVEELTALLRKNGIEAEASADGDILSHPITTSIRALISAVVSPANERHLFEILHSGYAAISANDLVRLVGGRSYARTLSQIVEDGEYLESLGVSDVGAVMKIPKILREARKGMDAESPHRVLEYLLTETGFLDYVITAYPYEGGRVIRRLYDEVEEMVRHDEITTLRSVDEIFTTRITHGLALNAPYINMRRHAVRVMTAHKAKGLEFLHVLIPHLTDSRWGGKVHKSFFTIPITTHLNPDQFNKEDDERKLLYVALTRAKVGLYLSNSETNTEGRTFLMTRLVEGLGEGVITQVDTSSFEDEFDAQNIFAAPGCQFAIDSELFAEILRERGLSATALNNYLRDPWNYIYRNVLRIPEIQPESAQFGTTLHDTLRSVMKHRRESNELPSASVLKTYLERELEKLPVTPHEYARLHERAYSALTHYLAYVSVNLPHETKEEYKIQTVLKTGDSDFPEVLLTGHLDRLDFGKDGKLIRVVDYKSGKPKTRGYIEGTTKDSTGDYKRQLVFYALILSCMDDDRLKTKEGVLSFVEADEKGRIHEETYMITDEEIEELKAIIIRVVGEIKHGTFSNVPCNPEKSDYCFLAEELQKRISS
ncbi:MAG: ATP-dependent helicase [Candidatus Pacebacteria bacterium]|nr:ATP-dependent helicase [Candidatus Paceibacterota bacterium]MCF7857212.1 ATP-dependent helicase [Candidatus Paceibacterota bacterium]